MTKGRTTTGAHRRLIKKDDFHLYMSGENRTLCILLHGLGGSNDSAYWGSTADLLRFETRVSELDICFWRYPSSQSPFANLLAILRRGRAVGDIHEIVESLSTTIESLIGSYGYDRVIVAGHSLGGAIGVLAARHQIESGETRISHVCLMGTPQHPPLLAKIAAVFFRWNPHIRWLGSQLVAEVGGVSLPALRASAVHTTYIQYSRDEVLTYDDTFEFDARKSANGPHAWTSSVKDSKGAPYQALLDWMSLGARNGR